MIGPDPAEVLDALGIAWGAFELYPNPTKQAGFVGAMERLEVLERASVLYEIGANSVSCNDIEMERERGGTERLSLRLFVHEVEWLELRGIPTAGDVNRFFGLLAADEQQIRADGGIAGLLEQQEVRSISVTQRGLLANVVEKPWEERTDDQDQPDSESGTEQVLRLIATGAPPGEVAHGLIEKSAGDPAAMAASFSDAYRAVYPAAEQAGADDTMFDLLDAYRPTRREQSPIETFVEAFFLLPVQAQAQILGDFLHLRAEGMHALLLDQFAGTDLAQLAEHLPAAARELLVAYAREVVESEHGAAEDLLPLVSAARDVKSARHDAAGRVREMINGIGGLGSATGGLAASARGELADVESLSSHVLRNLFEVEERSDRFAQFAHRWTRRISAEVQGEDLSRALALVTAGTVDAELASGKRRIVESALVELLRSDYAVFNTAAHEPEHREMLAEILARFGEPAAVHLMERLSVEEDPATRRTLIGLLTIVGSSYSDPIARFLKAPEWYVVRNAVSIAGRIGGRKWVPHLRPLLDHDDHRVVVEAMRALAPLSPDEALPGLVNGLGHDDERVRETAYLLLQTTRARRSEAVLAAALTDPRMDSARTQIARLLFGLGTDEAIGVLEQIAGTFALRPSTRHARRAARAVLGSAA